MRCILIISQYYGDIQGFIVKYKTTTEEDWKNFISDLEKYKRDDAYCKRDYYFGDFEGFEALDCRHNVNDISGDIYVISCVNVEEAVYQLERIKEQSEIRIIKRFEKEILEHHDRNNLAEIIDRHFEIL